MRKIENILLEDLVNEQESLVLKNKKDRVGLLIKEKIELRERLKERIICYQEDLENVNATIEHLKNEDWSGIDWKLDDTEKG